MKHNTKDFQQIVEEVNNKACLKQKIYRNTLKTFKQFKMIGQEMITALQSESLGVETNVALEFQEKSAFEFEMKIGGDVLLIYMHTNVHAFEKNHPMWKTSYVQEQPDRNYCGVVYIYNFLADSFKYNRVNDIGHMIGRIFINKDQHFFVEGRRQLNFLFNDFINQKIELKDIQSILEQAILYSMSFDLTVPPYKHSQFISVGEVLQDSSTMRIKTAKRLGFRFSFDPEE
jgi:hypothetical protein